MRSAYEHITIVSFQYFVFSEPKLSVLLLKLSVSKPLMIFPVFDSPHINILLSLISLPTSGIPSQCLFSLLIFKKCIWLHWVLVATRRQNLHYHT